MDNQTDQVKHCPDPAPRGVYHLEITLLPDGRYIAYFLADRGKFAEGKTSAEAIGHLVQAFQEQLGLDIRWSIE